MAFTGKATYDAGTDLPELAEDISEIVGLISPSETPLLDALGDAPFAARSTKHEWLQDALNPNADAINNAAGYVASAATLEVDTASIFRVGDLLQAAAAEEVMQVTQVNATSLDVTRGYGGSTAEALVDNQALTILGHAALEGEDAAPASFQNRVRQTNFTQIFSETVHVSGTMDAVRAVGVEKEFDYQTINRLRELLRSLEQSVIGGYKAQANPQGSDTVRRTMGGIVSFIQGANAVISDAASANLSETMLNAALRQMWDQGGQPSAIVCGGFQKRKIAEFAGNRQYVPEDNTYRNVLEFYESDFGLQRILLSRWVPADKVLLLDLTKIHVLPLSGRSFFSQPLPAAGDYRRSQVLGEYTLEIHNAGEGAHGLIKNLSTS